MGAGKSTVGRLLAERLRWPFLDIDSLITAEHGLSVAKSFGSRYVEFRATDSPVKLALYSRRAAAKDAGVAADGTGSPRIVIVGGSGMYTDPDGFAWEAATTIRDRTPIT